MRPRYVISLSFLVGAFLLYVYVIPFALSVMSDDNDLRDDGAYSGMQRNLSAFKFPTGHTILPSLFIEIVVPLFVLLTYGIRRLVPITVRFQTSARAPPLFSCAF